MPDPLPEEPVDQSPPLGRNNDRHDGADHLCSTQPPTRCGPSTAVSSSISTRSDSSTLRNHLDQAASEILTFPRCTLWDGPCCAGRTRSSPGTAPESPTCPPKQQPHQTEKA